MDMNNIVAYRNIPLNTALHNVVKKVANNVRGGIEGLHLQYCPSKDKRKSTMTAYLRLTPPLDRDYIMKRHKAIKWAKYRSIVAFLPDKMPESYDPQGLPVQMKKSLATYPNPNVPEDRGMVFSYALLSTLRAMEAKYTELFKLSATKEHKLLDNIVTTMKDRLKEIMSEQSKDVTCLTLTKAYRDKYPHTTDFGLIMDTLHKIEEEEGNPKTELKEEDLIKPIKTYCEHGFKFMEMKTAAKKYEKSITTKHIEALDANESKDDSDEMKHRKIVRQHLKQMKNFIPAMVKTLVGRELTPRKLKQNCNVYGEPALPPTRVLRAFLGGVGVTKPRPCVHQYNMMVAQLLDNRLDKFLALDGTQLEGCTLILRKSEPSKYFVPESIIQEVKGLYGGSGDAFTEEPPAQEEACDETAYTAEGEVEE